LGFLLGETVYRNKHEIPREKPNQERGKRPAESRNTREEIEELQY